MLYKGITISLKYYQLTILYGLIMLSCEPAPPKTIHEVIVIGGGLMGSSTAWHLTAQNSSVLLLEKQDSIYTQGSSFGEARIARSNNRGNDIWSYLHNRSVRETEKLINYLNASGYYDKVSMNDIYTTSPVTYVGRTNIYDRLLASLKRQQVEFELTATPEEGKSKFGVHLPADVLIQREYNPYSGTLNPGALIHHLHQAIRFKGSEIRYGVKVFNVRFIEDARLFEVQAVNERTGETELLQSRKIVSAAGPYTGKLLHAMAPYLDTLVNPQRVFLAFLQIREDVYGSWTEEQKNKLQSFYPVINSSKGTRDGSFFSMIEYFDEKNHPVIKIGGHFQRSPIDDMDEVWNENLSEDEIEWSLQRTSEYMELLNLPVRKEDVKLVSGYSCVYSLTQSEVPLVTPILGSDLTPNEDFIVLAGMSGVGAKGAMTYGLIAANLMNDVVESDSMYQVTASALGFDRLLKDLKR